MAKPVFLDRSSKRKLPPNWRQRLKIVKTKPEYPNEVTFNLEFEGTLPKGFRRTQGTLTVTKKKPHTVCAVEVKYAFRFRGLGRLLYTHALKHFGQLSTRFPDASENAQHLWERLSEEYCYKKTSGRLTLTNRRKRTKKGLTYKNIRSK